MLIIDGIKYKLWIPKDEEKEFHPLVKEHSKEIFGENSIYFDIKHKLTSKSGIAGIPDAYVLTLSKPYEWYIVENELSSHPVYSHIVPQVSRFVDSIEELETQRDVRDILNTEIEQDIVLKAYIEKKTGHDLYRFLSELLSSSPKIALIIDKITPEVEKASKSLKKLANTKIIEFKTFLREGAPNVRAHLFEPLYEEEMVHATYDKSRNGFFCLIGDEKHTSILYDVVEIVKHLRDEHHINPKDQTIDGWARKFQRQWEEYERKEEGAEERYTESYHLKDIEKRVALVYRKIKTAMLKLDSNIKINPQKYYISLRKNKNFAYIELRKKKLHIVIMLPYETGSSIIRKHKLTQLSQSIQDFYNGACFQVTIEKEDNLEEVIKTLEEAYKQQIS